MSDLKAFLENPKMIIKYRSIQEEYISHDVRHEYVFQVLVFLEHITVDLLASPQTLRLFFTS